MGLKKDNNIKVYFAFPNWTSNFNLNTLTKEKTFGKLWQNQHMKLFCLILLTSLQSIFQLYRNQLFDLIENQLADFFIIRILFVISHKTNGQDKNVTKMQAKMA